MGNERDQIILGVRLPFKMAQVSAQAADTMACRPLLRHLNRERTPAMRLLIYASALSPVGRSLLTLSQSMDIQSTCCSSLEALDEYLRQPTSGRPIVLLAPSNDGELAALIGVRHLLRDMRLILLLPGRQEPADRHPNPHKLHPRFIGYADGDLSTITAILSKMNRQAPGRIASILN
jgi:hypothetical protein